MTDALQIVRDPGAAWPVELDAILGPAGGRYFGSGYRRVRYGGPDALDLQDDGTLRANVPVLYPSGWSKGPAGAERTPHLSTIDAVALPIIVFERVLAELGRSPRSLRVTAAQVRAASEPWSDLGRVPVVLSIQSHGENDWELAGRVGNMRILVRLQGTPVVRAASVAEWRGSAVTPYGGAFRDTVTSSVLVDVDVDGGTLLGRHRSEQIRKRARADLGGVEGAWQPGLTIIDHLAVMGEMAQAVISLCSGVSRESMGSLWMRSVDVRASLVPVVAPTEWTTHTMLHRDRAVRSAGFHDVRIHTASSTGVDVRASLAYSTGSPS